MRPLKNFATRWIPNFILLAEQLLSTQYVSCMLSLRQSLQKCLCVKMTDTVVRHMVQKGTQSIISLCFRMPVVERKQAYLQSAEDKCPQLAPLALDLLTAPAPEACVERLFSLCRDLTTGQRNRMQQSLQRRVFLKLKSKLFQANGYGIM